MNSKTAVVFQSTLTRATAPSPATSRISTPIAAGKKDAGKGDKTTAILKKKKVFAIKLLNKLLKTLNQNCAESYKVE